MSNKVNTDKHRTVAAILPPLLLVLLMWMVQTMQWLMGWSFDWMGVYPLDLKGIPGIVLMPLVHGGWKHLLANTIPFLVLGSALFYFYRDIAWRVLLGIWLLAGLWVWFGGRPSYHVGASGVIYGLSSFLFTSGAIRHVKALAALALVVAFLYGSTIWGVFPDFFPKEKNISWEGHLGGMVSGVIMALYYRKQGPQRKRYSWEFEDDNDDGDEEAYWRSSHT